MYLQRQLCQSVTICTHVCMLGVCLDGTGDESIKVRGLSDWKPPAITDCKLSDQVCKTIATQVALWSKDEGESCGIGQQVEEIEEPTIISETEDETSDSNSSISSSSELGDLSDAEALENGSFDLLDEVFNFHIRTCVRRCECKYVCACASRHTYICMYTLE